MEKHLAKLAKQQMEKQLQRKEKGNEINETTKN